MLAAQHTSLFEFRALLGARLTNGIATAAIATVVGFQVWQLTGDPLALGWLGLVEAIPALSLALYGGHVADRNSRRTIALITSSVATVAALLLALAGANPGLGLVAVLTPVFIVGLASGFERPALSAFEQQVIPIETSAKRLSALQAVSFGGSIVGPAVGGLLVAWIDVSWTYVLMAGLLAVSTGCLALVAPRPVPPRVEGESLWQSLTGGVRYVVRNQALVGSMALDLFAVFFGGAVALLPIFADEVLHVGPVGLGLLRTAPSVGALAMMLVATGRPPTRNTGRILLLCVAGFGVSMLVFGLSKSFLISLAALFMSGVFDGVSVIIRTLIVRVMSPEQLRGRISSVNFVFIGASNEIGAFESGVLARVLGTVPSVIAGAFATLAVVGVVAATLPQLRNLDLRSRLAEREAERAAADRAIADGAAELARTAAETGGLP